MLQRPRQTLQIPLVNRVILIKALTQTSLLEITQRIIIEFLTRLYTLALAYDHTPHKNLLHRRLKLLPHIHTTRHIFNSGKYYINITLNPTPSITTSSATTDSHPYALDFLPQPEYSETSTNCSEITPNPSRAFWKLCITAIKTVPFHRKIT